MSRPILWVLVLLGVLMLATAAEYSGKWVHRLAHLTDDPLPGARFRPTPEVLRRAQESARRRRMDDGGATISTLPR